VSPERLASVSFFGMLGVIAIIVTVVLVIAYALTSGPEE
jgi:hypothetical protein